MEIKPKEIELKDGRKVTIRSVKPSDAENMLAHLITTHSESYKNMNQAADFWKTLPVEQEQDIHPLIYVSSFEIYRWPWIQSTL